MKKVRFSFWVKVFVAGTIFPAIMYPIIVLLGNYYSSIYDLGRMWWMPFFFGFWNLFCFLSLDIKKRFIKHRVNRLLECGAILGLILAVIIVLQQKLDGVDMVLRLIAGPVIVALIWRYFTAYFNHLFGIED
jgi:hypothetical protein